MSPTRFDLTLTPWRDGAAWAGFDVRYRAELSAIPAGEPVLRIPERIASIPGTPYQTEDLNVSDASGPLALTEVERTSDPSSTYRHWVTDRDTDGAIEVAVRAPVRPIDARTPVGPLFDLRAEPLGLFGAGLTFLPLPLGDETFAIGLRWELPDGAVGLSSHGVGDQDWQGPLDTVAFGYYAAGTPTTVPADATTFGLHAFSEPTFDVAAVADYVRELHTEMARFFGDEGSNYHVFVRRNAGRGSGGTALPGSFAFGYSPEEPVVEDELRGLLAHEMAHDWPALDAEHVDGAWFTEGTAEYYSLVVPLRLGLSTPRVFAEQLTDKLFTYDTNPLRTLTNEAAGAAFWADPRAQRIPYGRGLRYLIATDAQIRAATQGEQSLDGVVLDIVRARGAGEKIGLDGWHDRVRALIGDEARTRFDAMVEGRPIALPETLFEGVVRPREIEAPEFDLGFDVASFRAEPRRIQGLVSGSAAAKAGLQEGDELLTRSLPHSSMSSGAAAITVAVRRDRLEHEVTYVPRGRMVPTVEWVIDSGTRDRPGGRVTDTAAWSQSTTQPRISTVTLADGTDLAYEVRWEQIELTGSDGELDATISGTSYVVAGDGERPATFLWNGGPGASSSPLHMRAFGPRIFTDDAPTGDTEIGAGGTVPNPHTLLGVSDLVFVDPVGTGFNRIARETAHERLLTIPGDTVAIETFMRRWLERHDRESAAIHLVGESFGGYRLARLCPSITDLRVESVTLISPMLDASAVAAAPGNDLPHVFELPTMAVAAWAHGKAARDFANVAVVWRRAESFAATELLPALYQGTALSATERRRLAERIAELIAVPVEAVLDASLRVESEDFLRTLLADEDLLLGRLDVRVTGPMTPIDDDRPPAADDPALGIGRSNVKHSEPLAAYLRDEVGVDVEGPYVSLSLELNFAWDWRPESPRANFYTTAIPDLAELVTARPGTRVLLLGGYFDLATPLSSTTHAIRHAGLPATSVEVVPLLAGHSIDAVVLPEASAAVRRIIDVPS